MRRFAKLFDFGDQGQLLVQRANSDEPEDDDAPYKLVLKTRNEQGVQVEITPAYASEEDRDEDFDAFGQEAADRKFINLQKALTGMSSPL